MYKLIALIIVVALAVLAYRDRKKTQAQDRSDRAWSCVKENYAAFERQEVMIPGAEWRMRVQ